MEETIVKPGIFSKLAGLVNRHQDDYEDDFDAPVATPLRVHSAHRYSITVRRQVVSFQDAVAAADGLKRGEQQVLNLTLASELCCRRNLGRTGRKCLSPGSGLRFC